MKKGICKLCLSDSELRHSHILPEFMYQNLYNVDIRRFHSFEINLDNLEDAKKRIQQKGVREYLLCQNCETLLSKYEQYAAETLYGKNLKNQAYLVDAQQTPDENFFLYNYAGFNYQLFRIFLLSILWRIIISESFKTPEIAEEKIEALRVAIINENPLNPSDYGCLLQVIKYAKGQLAKGFILSPYTTGQKDEIINILIDGFIFSFYMENQSVKEESFFLQTDGTMKIFGRILFEDKQLFEKLNTAFEHFK
jgi:hypothetical protein